MRLIKALLGLVISIPLLSVLGMEGPYIKMPEPVVEVTKQTSGYGFWFWVLVIAVTLSAFDSGKKLNEGEYSKAMIPGGILLFGGIWVFSIIVYNKWFKIFF